MSLLLTICFTEWLRRPEAQQQTGTRPTMLLLGSLESPEADDAGGAREEPKVG